MATTTVQHRIACLEPPQAMYLTRRAELAEAAALISPLELPPTMRSAAAASNTPPIQEEPTARGRHTSAASLAGSTLPHVVNLNAGSLHGQP